MLPIGAVHILPTLPLGLLELDTAGLGRFKRRQTLPRLSEGLLGLSQITEDGQRIALGQIMAEVKQVWNAQAIQARFSQLDQCLGPVAYQI